MFSVPAWVRRLRFPERTFLLALLLLCGSLLAFVELAGEVGEGDLHRLDRDLLLALRRPGEPAVPLGPGWLPLAARDVTALGGFTVVTLVACGVTGFLLIEGRRRAALFLVAAVAGGALASTALKLLFARERPTVVPRLVEVDSFSFPSGHSLAAVVTYLTLGAMLARQTQDRLLRLYVLTLAGGLVLLIGLSRVYLGVHYPTDVLGGWCAGSAWALLCAVGAYWLQRRGQMEPPTPVAGAGEAPKEERASRPGEP